MIQNVIKRDGRVCAFDKDKISAAVYKAAHSVGGTDKVLADTVAEKVEELLIERYADAYPTVEQVQDAVEKVLIECGYAKTAKAYILYRAQRNRVRQLDSTLMKELNNLTIQKAYDSDTKRENANINTDTAMGTMLKYGSEASKAYSHLSVLSPEQSTAHSEGDIHIHDLDFYNLTETCVQIGIGDLLRRGFSTEHGYVRTPAGIGSAAALACIAIQANQNDQHGGQSIWDFDYGLGTYVAKSYITELINHLEDMFENFDDAEGKKKLDDFRKKLFKYWEEHDEHIMNEAGYSFIRVNVQRLIPDITDKQLDRLFTKVDKAVDRLTFQAMEALIHNLNTMQSRAGSQVPFSSVNMGTDTSTEGRLVIKNLLLATEKGLGNGETAIFPVSIFKVKEGVNYNKGEPNYDLFHLACKVSAKRLFPNFSFIDAPFNITVYEEGRPETEVAVMGCVDGDEVITYKFGDNLYVEGFARAYMRICALYGERNQNESCNISSLAFAPKYIDTEGKDVSIYDSHSRDFVKVKKIIKNPNLDNWKMIVFDNGRVLTATANHPLPVEGKGRTYVSDMQVGDAVPVVWGQYAGGTASVGIDKAWLYGLMLTEADYGFHTYLYTKTSDHPKVLAHLRDTLTNYYPGTVVTHPGDSREILLEGTSKHLCDDLERMFEGEKVVSRHVPTILFSCSTEERCAFVAGVLDSLPYNKIINGTLPKGTIHFRNREMALQFAALVQSVGAPANVSVTPAFGKRKTGLEFTVEFSLNDAIMEYVHNGDLQAAYCACEDKEHTVTVPCETAKVVAIFDVDSKRSSYDVETESDRFDVSGIYSHNCRTRVLGNVHDPSRQIVSGRGNLSFTSINLPRLAIEAKKDLNKFYKDLDKLMDLVIEQLLDRMEIQSAKHVYNYPMLMGQGIWIDSLNLNDTDTVAEVLKHGTLGVGFIGLAECLKALTGKHHGESAESQKLGLEILGHMRKRLDEESEKRKLNFSLLGTPKICGHLCRNV